MSCIKTGAHAYLEEYNEYAYGDMHLIKGLYVMRVAQVSHKALRDKLHFSVHTVNEFWRENPTSIILSSIVTDLGYDGLPIKHIEDE